MTTPDDWYALPVHTGRLIRLEPMTAEHAPGYLDAAGAPDDAERGLPLARPSGRPAHGRGRRGHRSRAPWSARAHGARFAYAQFDVASGAVRSGRRRCTTCHPALRTLAIGFTWLGRRVVAHRPQHRVEAAAAALRLRRARLRARRLAHRHLQRALAGGDRPARRDARGRAAQAPDAPRRHVARHRPVLDDRRRLAGRPRPADRAAASG